MIIHFIASSDFYIKWPTLCSATGIGLYTNWRKRCSKNVLFSSMFNAILSGYPAKSRYGKFDFVTCAIADKKTKNQ
jgi:hypothetical protein